MIELNYSKKQINPIVEKYQINVNENKVFHAIILMFNGQTPYQIWAIKSIFEGVINIQQLEQIKIWAENNQTDIKNLSKQNIVSYKTKSDFELLFKEMEGLRIINTIKHVISMFNTDQRNILNKHIFSDEIKLSEVSKSKKFNDAFKLLDGITKMAKHRREKLISTSSALRDISSLYSHIRSAFSESYEWDKEDLLCFLENNCKDCTVVHNEGNIVIVEVPSFNSSQKLCGGGRTGWCLTREESYFRRYTKENENATQYFLFDFSKKEDHELAHVGFSVNPKNGINYAHSTKNHSLIGSGFTIDGVRTNINDVLSKNSVPKSAFIRLKTLKNFNWNAESLLKFLNDNYNKDCVTVSVNENNRVVLNVSSIHCLERILNHTLINLNNFALNQNTKLYAVFDFNLDVNNEKSILVLYYVKDEYKIDTFSSCFDGYGGRIDNLNYFETIGLSTSKFINRQEIEPRIMLHKLIDERNEKEAIELIKKYGNDIDVNYEFNNRIPVYQVIENKLYNLFAEIINHPKFDGTVTDIFCETLFHSLLFNYLGTVGGPREDSAAYKKMINLVLDSNVYDMNIVDLNEDTVVNVSCGHPELYWVAERLISNPNININVVNDWNCTALTEALKTKNHKVLEILGKRVDLVVREEDKEMAAKNGIDLSKYINPQPIVNTKSEKVTFASKSDEEAKMEEFAKVFSEILKARKG